MRFLVFGANGWIGSQVLMHIADMGHLYEVAKSRADNDTDVENEIKAYIEKYSDVRVICLIGRTHGEGFTTIDYLEQKGKIYENVRDNLYSPLSLAFICKKHNVHLTYMGTGCIFNYDDSHTTEKGFTEEDKPNFFGSSYSVVKGFTDRLIHNFDNVLNVRIRMPITGEKNPRNFITKITSYEKICSIPNSMTVLPELLPIMLDMSIKKESGTINMTNPGVITHNEILEMYKEIVDPEFTWTNFTIEEQSKVLLSARSNNYLDTTRLESMYKVKNIKESVRDMLYTYKM